MAGTGENAPLLGPGGDSQNYYFLNPQKYGSHSRDGDEGATVEDLPQGATAEDFEPRILGTPIQVRIQKEEMISFPRDASTLLQ